MNERSNIRSRRQVLRIIKSNNGLSRAELARITGLTRPTISTIIEELAIQGLVVETGKGTSRGGKRPVLIELNPNAAYALGIDLADASVIRGVLCDLAGKIIRHKEIPYQNNYNHIYEALVDLVNHLNNDNLKGIGIAASGLIDIANNEIIRSKNFDIAKKQLAVNLKNHFGIPVILENRPNAAAFAEKTAGAGVNFKNLIYVSSGRGAGAGIIIDGKVFRGSHDAAGEIGLMLMPFEPEPEYKGKKYYFEDLNSDTTLTRMISAAKKSDYKFKDVVNLYLSGDPDAVRIFAKDAQFLAYAMRTVTNIIDTEAIILGGRTQELGERYLDEFKKHFYKGSGSSNVPQVFISNFGRLGVPYGGALTVLDKICNFML